jgi:hypothetical protein
MKELFVKVSEQLKLGKEEAESLLYSPSEVGGVPV